MNQHTTHLQTCNKELTEPRQKEKKPLPLHETFFNKTTQQLKLHKHDSARQVAANKHMRGEPPTR